MSESGCDCNTFRLRISVQLTLTYVSMHFATFLQALFMSERSLTKEVKASDCPKSAVRYTLGKLATLTIPVIEDLWITFTPSNSTTQKP